MTGNSVPAFGLRPAKPAREEVLDEMVRRLVEQRDELMAALAALVDRNAQISNDTILLSMGSHGQAITALNRARAAIAKVEGRIVNATLNVGGR